MIYVISSSDSNLLKQAIYKNIKDKGIEVNEFNVQSFDMYNQLIQDAIDSATQTSFFDSMKVVICYNCYFLSDQAPAIASWRSKMDFTSLEKYVANQNPECDLYLTSLGKLNSESSNKLIKLLKQNAKIENIQAKTSDDLVNIGISYVGNNLAEISKDAILEVVKRTNNDYTLMINTLDKLMCYTNKIRIEDVNVLVAPKLEDDIFVIVNDLFKFLIKDAIHSYRDLISKGNYPVSLIPVFASQFEFLYEVSKLTEEHLSNDQIANQLKCKSGKVYYAKKSLGNFTSKDILNMMVDLHEIEVNIKFDLDNPNDRLEIFILNFRKNYFHK